MNTVMRTLGGAIGAQIAATFIAGHVLHGLPTVTGFSESFALALGFLTVAVVASAAVPRRGVRGQAASPSAAAASGVGSS